MGAIPVEPAVCSLKPLIVVMFGQFILTSRRARPIYDPVGKYYGVSLFCAVGVTLVMPHAAIRRTVLEVILGFTLASLVSRAMFLLGFTRNRAPGQDSPGAWRRWRVELWRRMIGARGQRRGAG